MLGVEPWLGAKAVETRVKKCASPWVLHLATHGFFLPDRIDPDTSTHEPEAQVRGSPTAPSLALQACEEHAAAPHKPEAQAKEASPSPSLSLQACGLGRL